MAAGIMRPALDLALPCMDPYSSNAWNLGVEKKVRLELDYTIYRKLTRQKYTTIELSLWI